MTTGNGVQVQQRPVADEAAAGLAELPPVLRRVYAARDIRSREELDLRLARLAPADPLKGLDRAVDELERALVERHSILILGDFDADGATSCALAVRALRAMGAASVDYLVPNRFEYGYGLTPEIAAVAAERAPDLLITVDNGISSVDGVAAAHELGMRVIVTDHHLPGRELPAAEAIVNPNQADDAFPSKHLAGVGVTFYVLAGLRARLRDRGWFAAQGLAEPSLGQFLDLVALGTVADVVRLDRNNRVLVDQGLRRIRAGQACPGILALLDVAGRDPNHAGAGDLGFAVGPRLNAAGRLEDMSLGIECLLADDRTAARAAAERLDALNRERRSIEGRMQTEALAALERLHLEDAAALPTGLCLFDPEWHQGVIGVLASRLKDRFHRPVVTFARAGEGQIKGSVRSVDGVHARDVLEAVATRHDGLVARFGGHAMAAGLSLAEDRFEAFRDAFDEEVRRQVGDAALSRVLYTDGELAPEDFTLDLARALEAGGPWGAGFPEPLFDGVFRVLDARVVGERHVRLRVQPEGGRAPVEGIAFNALDAGWSDGWARVRLIYRFGVNRYGGTARPQLMVSHFFPV